MLQPRQCCPALLRCLSASEGDASSRHAAKAVPSNLVSVAATVGDTKCLRLGRDTVVHKLGNEKCN